MGGQPGGGGRQPHLLPNPGGPSPVPPGPPQGIRRMTTTLAQAQARVDRWISQFEEGYFHPLTNLARLTEEVGELAREGDHRFGPKTRKASEDGGDPGVAIGA